MGSRPAALALCALALAACGGSDGAEVPPAGLTGAEVRWVRAFASWAADLERAVRVVRVAPASDPVAGAGARSALRRIAACSASLARSLPAAPTRRLTAAARLLRRACLVYERFGRARVAAFGGGDRGEALFRAEAADARAAELMLTAHQSLGNLLRENRVLRSSRGGSGSRVDPLYGRLATALGGGPVEVRCWSAEEWPHVLRERWALSRGDLRAARAHGFVWADDRRAHLPPDVCAALDRFSLDGGGAGTRTLAVALVALARAAGRLGGPGGAAEVECRAIQDAPGVARGLGADAGDAERLADLLRAEEHARDCRPAPSADADPDRP